MLGFGLGKSICYIYLPSGPVVKHVFLVMNHEKLHQELEPFISEGRISVDWLPPGKAGGNRPRPFLVVGCGNRRDDTSWYTLYCRLPGTP